MIPGDVIAYCCEDPDTAARILAESGAEAVAHAVDDRTGTRTQVVIGGTPGELTAAHT